MRPLVHPALDDLTPEGILYALADPVRAQIFAEIAVSKCAHTCKSFLEVSDRRVPKSTLSKHFGILREAGLIHSTRVGKEMHNVLREDVVKERFDPLVTAIINAHREQELHRRSRASAPWLPSGGASAAGRARRAAGASGTAVSGTRDKEPVSASRAAGDGRVLRRSQRARRRLKG
ncbi:hypothetical protein B1810_07985 [Panacagrimonas perspica]|nr:hypothetical protein B1810_07985 [Panacagrimonas perspica]